MQFMKFFLTVLLMVPAYEQGYNGFNDPYESYLSKGNIEFSVNTPTVITESPSFWQTLCDYKVGIALAAILAVAGYQQFFCKPKLDTPPSSEPEKKIASKKGLATLSNNGTVARKSPILAKTTTEHKNVPTAQKVRRQDIRKIQRIIDDVQEKSIVQKFIEKEFPEKPLDSIKIPEEFDVDNDLQEIKSYELTLPNGKNVSINFLAGNIAYSKNDKNIEGKNAGTDAIVNLTNEHCFEQTHLGRKITALKEGPFKEIRNNFTSCSPDKPHLVFSGYLMYEINVPYIIYIATPNFKTGKIVDHENIELITNTYVNSLKIVDDWNEYVRGQHHLKFKLLNLKNIREVAVGDLKGREHPEFVTIPEKKKISSIAFLVSGSMELGYYPTTTVDDQRTIAHHILFGIKKYLASNSYSTIKTINFIFYEESSPDLIESYVNEFNRVAHKLGFKEIKKDN